MLKHFNLAAVAWSCLACYWFWAFDKTGNAGFASVMTVIGLISSLSGATAGFAYDRLSERMFIGYQIRRLERKRARGKMTPDFYQTLGWAHSMQKNYRKLIEVYEEARGKGLMTSAIYHSLGFIYGKQEMWDKTVDILEEARSREMLTANGYHNLAGALIHLGKMDRLDILVEDAKQRGFQINVDEWLKEIGGVTVCS